MRRLRIYFSPRFLGTRLILLGIALGFVTIFPGDTPGGNSIDAWVLAKAKESLFNYVAWETDAIIQKIEQGQAGAAPYLTETQRSQYVHDYFDNVRRLQALNGKIDA